MLRKQMTTLLLLAEAPILLVTLGLMAWGLRILSLSLGFALDPLSRSFILVPLDQPYSQVVTRTVTAYRISSVGPPTIRTFPSSLDIDAYHDPEHPSTKTIPESLQTLQGPTYGYDPTATRTYTVTETGIRPISHLVLPKEAEANEDKRAASPSPTAAPVILPRETSYILQARQRVIRYDGDYTGYSLNQPFTSYADVTVNHGFGRYFFEAGINYVYTTGYAGYSPDDLKRVRALTAMMSIAFAAIVGRLACTVVYLYSLRKRKGVPHPTLGLVNLALTLLILLTYIPFWSLYGSWTNRNAAVQAADAEFQTDGALYAYDLEDLLHSTPWQGTTVALITFWTISIMTSLLLSLRVLFEGKNEDAEKGQNG